MQEDFPHPILYWQEARPVELYEQILSDFGIRTVFDLSPGSGALAEACLRMGLTYAGVTCKQTHCRWLGNVLDRFCLAHMTTPGRPCHSKEYAPVIQSYCADILLSISEAAEAEDIDWDTVLDNVAPPE